MIISKQIEKLKKLKDFCMKEQFEIYACDSGISNYLIFPVLNGIQAASKCLFFFKISLFLS